MTEAERHAQQREKQGDAILKMAGATGPIPYTPEERIAALQSLIKVLGSGLKIVEQYLDGDIKGQEPYPGAVGHVVKHSRTCIEIAEKTGALK